jgi:uncharacterized membrane protein
MEASNTMPEIVSFLRADVENQKKHENDSKYTRFIRRKFQCIIIFLILFITLLEFLNVFIPKLSPSNIDSLNGFLNSILNKTQHLM